MSEYPECEKLHKVKDQSFIIGQFLEWLQEDYAVARWDGNDLFPDHPGIEKLIAEYFNIDLNKVEKEKQEILAELRK